MTREETKEATSQDIKESSQRCWGCQKKKPPIKMCDWTGWEFCLKCWRRDYRYGREHGLWQAIKDLRKIKIQLTK
jgi:hypothetical protein